METKSLDRSSVFASPRRFVARALVFALAGASVLALLAAPARAERAQGVGPCDDLVDHIRNTVADPIPEAPDVFKTHYRLREGGLEDSLQSTSPTMAYLTRVTPECRAEIRRRAAPAAIAAARALMEQPKPGARELGRGLLCTMQDPDTLDEVTAWMADDLHPRARAVCAAALATWLGAASVRGPIFERAVRRLGPIWPGNWEVDPAVVAAANMMGTPELREQLVPVLATARKREATGYDQLRAAVCAADGAISDDRARACSILPARAEADVRRRRARRDARLMRGIGTALYAGTVTMAYVDRNGEGGRDLATAGGAIGGTVLGGVLGGVAGAGLCQAWNARDREDCAYGAGFVAGLAGMVAGGVLGGMAAQEASPGARAPVTAVGFAPLYLFTLAASYR